MKKWTWGGLGAIITAIVVALAGGNKPPKKPVDPPAGDVRVAVTVRDSDRKPIPNLTCALTPDQLPGEAVAPAVVPCDYTGIQAFFKTASVDRGAALVLTADDFEPQRLRVVLHRAGDIRDSEDKPFEVQMEPLGKPLPRIVVRDQYLQLETGERWTYIGNTDFALLARYVHGEDITPVLAQRQAVGFNVPRVFTAFDVCADGIGCQQIGRLLPSENYYDKIRPFLRLLAKYGQRPELVGFAGKWSPSATSDQMVAHWSALVSAVCGQEFFAFVELANEYDHPANAGVPLERMSRPSCLSALFSNASATQDTTPRMPVWDYATYRPGSGPEWTRKVAHNGMEDVADKFHVPTVANETTRFPDNASSVSEAYDAAAGAALLSAGATFHSVRGKNSTTWDGVELQAARSWVLGAVSVPLRCQGGFYRRFDDPVFLRVYARGSDPACRVEIRRRQ